MPLKDISSQDLARLCELIKEKQELCKQIEAIDLELEAIESGKGGKRPVKARKVAATRKSAGRKGKLKEAIMEALQSAGAEGVAIKDLAGKLQLSPTRLSTWFGTTGKTLLKAGQLKKLGRGRFAWVA